MLEGLAARVTVGFFSAMLWLGTGEVLRVGEACSGLLAAVEGGHATEVRERMFFFVKGVDVCVVSSVLCKNRGVFVCVCEREGGKRGRKERPF